MKHTGPWKYRRGVSDIVAENKLIAHMVRLGPEDDANGYLLAAAPAMFAALTDVAKFYQDNFDIMPVNFQTMADIIDAALSAARGER